MAIKPKSRAHEDRIKALEAKVAALQLKVEPVEPWRNYVHYGIAGMMQDTPPRPWYKRIFGL